MKVCIKCGEDRGTEDFSKHRGFKSGRTSECKFCEAQRKQLFNRTRIGLIHTMYKGQQYTSKRRKHDPPAYSKQELVIWVTCQHNFEKLYLNWVKSEYATNSIPSCDRLDDYKPYTLSNIRLVTWRDNMHKQANRVKQGLDTRSLVPVLQLDLQGNIIATHLSQHRASRVVGINHKHISRVCTGKRKTAGGFKWEYKN